LTFKNFGPKLLQNNQVKHFLESHTASQFEFYEHLKMLIANHVY